MSKHSAHIRRMVLASLFSALMGLCAWLSIPLGTVNFTLQLFAVLLALGVLGGKWGCISICLYLLLGAVGAPVFSGFRGGIGALLDPTGGFLLGFLATGAIYRLVTAAGERWVLAGMALGTMGCYLFGAVWFSQVYGVRLAGAFLTCVVPYLLPDGVKIWLAYTLSRQLKKRLG